MSGPQGKGILSSGTELRTQPESDSSRMKGASYVVPAAKLDAAGNIIVVIDARSQELQNLRDETFIDATLHSGIPFVDMYCLMTESSLGLRATFWNPDGTPEKICGNALRSLPFLNARIPEGKRIVVETEHTTVQVYREGEKGVVEFPWRAIHCSPLEAGQLLVDLGTPHIVALVSDLFTHEVYRRGIQLMCSRPAFNATFVKMESSGLMVRTWERGVGETRSCGTGALAAYLATGKRVSKMAYPPMDIYYASGEKLTILPDPDGNFIAISGRCAIVSLHCFYV